MARTYATFLEQPSLAPDSLSRAVQIQQLHSRRLSRAPVGLRSAFESSGGTKGAHDPWPH